MLGVRKVEASSHGEARSGGWIVSSSLVLRASCVRARGACPQAEADCSLSFSIESAKQFPLGDLWRVVIWKDSQIKAHRGRGLRPRSKWKCCLPELESWLKGEVAESKGQSWEPLTPEKEEVYAMGRGLEA